MCLSVPARVLAIEDVSWAIVEVGGARKRIAIDLVEDLAVGDYVLVHVGFALQKIDEVEAQQVLELFEQMVSDEVHR